MKTKFLHIFLFLLLGLGVQAQVTTSSISGLVTDMNNEPLIGATVLAVHTPSGTSYGAVTREDGRFNLPGMRVGGPYTITTSYVGYQETVDENVFLNLGQTFTLNKKLAESGVTLDALTVTANKNAIMNDKKTGASTNVGLQALSSLPTISRSISDFTRTTPQSNGRSIGGQDARFNNLTIDGSIFNNSFGLSDLPGGQTNSTPISLDAIEQIQINVAPYDVREGGFTGAGINAVTRSGTNEFSGSVFYNLRNESFVGKKANGSDVITANFDVKQYGFRLGGPIIKDKLFFFINGESERREDPANSGFEAFRPGVNDGGVNTTRVLASDLDALKTFLINKYNYDPGVYENYQLATKSDKALARLDYNLSNKSKFSLRYNYLKSSRDVPASSSGAFSGRAGNAFALNFSNNNYIINNDINSFIGEHNYVGSNFSNKIIAGFTANRDYRSSGGGIFPLVDILEGGRNYIAFGYEPFTPNNILDTDTWQFRNDFTYYKGNHTITAGVSFESFEFRNTFTPTYYGQFVYNSLADFYADTDEDPTNDPTLRRYQKTSSNLAGSALPTATTNASQIGLYLQDEFQVNNKLKITAGVRFDVPSFKNTALENAEVSGFAFNDEFGDTLKFNTSKLPGTTVLFSPRLGFNFDVNGDQTLQVRGGTGVFSGRPAFVWLSNQVGNNGILTGSVFEDNTKNYPFNPDVNAYNLDPNPGQAASSYAIAMTAEDFKFPQIWRSNIAVDVALPLGLIATAEFIYNKDLNNVTYINANLKPAAKELAGPDNRPLYGGNNANNRVNSKITDATLLKNTDVGKGYSVTFKIEKPSSKGLNYMAAYNYGYTRDLMSAGSIAFSSWRDNLSVNGNNLPDVAFSNNDLRHRIIAAGSYKIEYANAASTQFGIFFQMQNQGRFSYRINGDLNGDQGTANDLMFVPVNATDLNFEQYTVNNVVLTPEAQAAALDKYIDQDDYLSTRRGQYAERNGVLIPMLATIDLSIVQEFYVKVGGKKNSLQVRADIFNFGNLISNKWGVGDRFVNNSPLTFRSINAEGEPVYRLAANTDGTFNDKTYIKSAGLSDVWQMQLGVRYTFN